MAKVATHTEKTIKISHKWPVSMKNMSNITCNCPSPDQKKTKKNFKMPLKKSK